MILFFRHVHIFNCFDTNIHKIDTFCVSPTVALTVRRQRVTGQNDT